MGSLPEDFDDRIDEITAAIREIQQAYRQTSVQKAQCSRVIISCHDVVNKLREAEDDPDVVKATEKCTDLISELRSEATEWPGQLKTWANGLGLLLVARVDHSIKSNIERLLSYTDGFPSIFGNIQRDKWLADLDRCRMRDLNSNKIHFQALVDSQDETLMQALEEDDHKIVLQQLADEFDMLEELSAICTVSGADVAAGTPRPSQIETSSTGTSQNTKASPVISEFAPQSSSRPRDNSLDVIWTTISKLEEHVGGDPAFEAQMEQLRKIAQAAMISRDEALDKQTKPNLLKKTTITQSSEPPNSPIQSLRVNLMSNDLHLHVVDFAGSSLEIPNSPSLAMQSRNTHVLDYIKSNPSSNRFRICTDISQGLAHMHTMGIVLGDFAPWNVTVDESGNVRLRELNLSDSAIGRPARGTWRSQLPDARYIPPEVITLPPEEGARDPNPRKSDVYAFTLLIYEILSGLAPWDKLDIPSIISQVTRGNRPPRPSPSAWLDKNEIWTLVQRGWDQKPENRPEMTLYAHDLDRWKGVVPETLDHNGVDGTQQPTTPTAELFSWSAPYMRHSLTEDSATWGLEKVAMKRLRIATIGDEDVVKKRFIRECEVWRKLKHPNVLEFYGIVKHGGSLFMISPFLDDGDAPRWLHNRCDHRLRVLLEAARGCLYLHTLSPKPTVHGDIKGANILIKSNGQAVLADFGLSKTMNAHTSHGLKDTGTGPYMAPELFAHCNDPDVEIDAMTVPVTKTLETDVFAFGRTALELLSGQTPYGNAAATPAIWYILLQGKRPARPNTSSAKRWITDAMWAFINEMTHVQPEYRPTMHEVVARLERFSLELDPNHCLNDDVDLEDTDDEADLNHVVDDSRVVMDDDDNDDEDEEGDSTGEVNTGPSAVAIGKRRATGPVPTGILKSHLQEPGVPKPLRSVQFANDPSVSDGSPEE
ncbi:Tyrosine kinase domain protein [Ceratobasidium sp. AG-Ba]|nr:Tyrosine kinase domain protein [Ceratobasidium sp. AG-Ba]